MSIQDDPALVAALLRAETAEAYLQQAEARIEELEQLVSELASKVPQSDLDFLQGTEWEESLQEMLKQKGQRFSEMFDGLEMWKQKLGDLPDHERRKLMDAFRNKYFDYDAPNDRYRRKPIDPDRKATDEFRKQREDEFRREYNALKGQLPPELKKEAEKYLNDFLGSGALGKRQADEFEERKTGGVPGALYRIEFYAQQPGMVELRVENTEGRYRIDKAPKPSSAQYYAQRMPDNLSLAELADIAERFANEIVRGLKIGGRLDDTTRQFAKDVIDGYTNMRKNGLMRRVVER